MRLYGMAHKAVLRFRNNAADFLKDYTSNSLDAPRNAFLDARGNIIATVEQKILSENEGLVVMEKKFVERLRSHLAKYLELGETVLEEEPGWKVYYDLDGDYKPAADEIRLGSTVLSPRQLPANVSEEEFLAYRLKRRLPLQGVDYDREMLLNVGEEFVSYTKGCFLGQEIVARVHHRSKPPKRLEVRSAENMAEEEIRRMTSKWRDPRTGKISGFIFTAQE